MGFLFARKFSPLAGAWALVETTQSRFDKALAGALNRGDTGVERRDNLLIGQAISSVQEDAGAGHFAGGGFTACDEVAQLLAFLSQ
jgi:hypothetical protein